MMAGYWPWSYLAFLLTSTLSRSIIGWYPVILTSRLFSNAYVFFRETVAIHSPNQQELLPRYLTIHKQHPSTSCPDPRWSSPSVDSLHSMLGRDQRLFTRPKSHLKFTGSLQRCSTKKCGRQPSSLLCIMGLCHRHPQGVLVRHLMESLPEVVCITSEASRISKDKVWEIETANTDHFIYKIGTIIVMPSDVFCDARGYILLILELVSSLK